MESEHISPEYPQPQPEPYTPPPTRTPYAAIVAVVLALAMIGLAAYAVREHSNAQALAAQSAQMTASLASTHSEVEALSSKLTSMEAERQAAEKQAAERAAAQQVQQRRQSTRVGVQRRRADDERYKKLQAQLDDQGKQIGDTRNDLSTARTELSGSIARTHDELVVLQRRGEKSYYEFDLTKSKQFQRAGPVGVSLRKASTKDMFADLKLMVEDAQVGQKHVNLYQPVMFYAGDTGQPIELVINSISKNHIHGYISEAKYNKADLAAMSAQAQPQPGAATTAANQANAANGAQSAPPQRRRLTLPPQ